MQSKQRTAKAVIGANFGDEGKGLITDYLATKDSVVIRFNGGAQAGHTVQTPGGRRHVFKHMGSGTLAGAATYLSQFFLSDPTTFEFEYEQLSQLGVSPTIFVDPKSYVVTPYDVAINCILEESRQHHRHGSCGLGIGETVERSQYPAFALTVGELSNQASLCDKLNHIRSVWVKNRLEALQIKRISEFWQDWLTNENILRGYLWMVEFFLNRVNIVPIKAMQDYTSIIFEGAQGLLLDQNHRWFPHVTRSNTGCKNIIPLLKSLNYDALDIYYISRAYLTRHGRGPLPHELAHKPFEGVYEKTNVDNDYQESLRYAFLNLPLLDQAIKTDLQSMPSTIACQYSLALTCMDQVGDSVEYYVEPDRLISSSKEQLINTLKNEFKLPVSLTSNGPTRVDVTPRC